MCGIIDGAVRLAAKKQIAIAAIVKAENAFDDVLISLKDAYTRAWEEAQKKALADALSTIRAMTPEQVSGFSRNEADILIRNMEGQVGKEAMQSLLNGPVINLSEAMYKIGMTETIAASAGLDFAFGLPDVESLNLIRQANLYWIGNAWDSYTYEHMKDILGDYFGKGMTRAQLAERFAEDFAAMGQKGAHYWELLADHTATKTRELGRINVYETAKIERVRIRARMDDRTTRLCRYLNNKIISVRRIVEQKNAYLEAISRHDAIAAKEIWPMMKDSDMPGEEVVSGIGMPPYHFRCRTITVAELV